MIRINIYNTPGMAQKLGTYLTAATALAFPQAVTTSSSASALMNQHEAYDILLFHLDRKDADNLSVIEKIRQQHPNTVWILTFSGDKPSQTLPPETLFLNEETLNLSAFNEVFMQAVNQYNALHSTITLQNKNTRYRIRISDIRYVEGYNRHIIVYAENRNYEALGKMSDAFNILASHGFIRVHQGYLVNIDYIKIFDKNDVILTDGTKVMVSARKRKPALQAFDYFSDLLHHQKLTASQ